MTKREIFQKTLPYYMARADVNQAELAKAVGVTKSTVHYWLSGKAYPRVDVVQKIADALGCMTDDLIVEERMPYGRPGRRVDPEIMAILKAEFDYDKQIRDLWETAPTWVKRVTITTMKALLSAAKDLKESDE